MVSDVALCVIFTSLLNIILIIIVLRDEAQQWSVSRFNTNKEKSTSKKNQCIYI